MACGVQRSLLFASKRVHSPSYPLSTSFRGYDSHIGFGHCLGLERLSTSSSLSLRRGESLLYAVFTFRVWWAFRVLDRFADLFWRDVSFYRIWVGSCGDLYFSCFLLLAPSGVTLVSPPDEVVCVRTCGRGVAEVVIMGLPCVLMGPLGVSGWARGVGSDAVRPRTMGGTPNGYFHEIIFPSTPQFKECLCAGSRGGIEDKDIGWVLGYVVL